ncbi:MAG TPA: hypothetical protein VMU18_10105, partial [Rhodoblastus sp.]|nr:hypothetical protein [Rhodoblastus sp.]
DGLRRLRRTPRRLVVRHALLGGAPEWRIDPPEVVVDPRWYVREVIRVGTLTGFMEQEIEADGFDKVRRVPKPGAYRKTFLEPDPRDGVVSRAEYEVWRAALDVLFEDLRGTLSAFDVQPCGLPMRPWEEGEAVPARVLPDLRVIDSGEVRGRRKKISTRA